MQFGKDWYKIVNVFGFIVQLLTWIGKYVNTDTPVGQLKDNDPSA